MKRVAVVGAPGSGKTTFANQLAVKTKLPVIYLDNYFHAKEYDSHGEIWYEKVDQLTSGEEWIVDGNYSSTFELRFDRADTIIFLDYPRRISMLGVYKRRLMHQNKHRPEMPDDWQERMTWSFFKFCWTFNKRYRHKIADPLSKRSSKAIIIKSPKQAQEYLDRLNEQE